MSQKKSFIAWLRPLADLTLARVLDKTFCVVFGARRLAHSLPSILAAGNR
jgi:hypothetical protein